MNPMCFILDEPLAGVDIELKRRIYGEFIKNPK